MAEEIFLRVKHRRMTASQWSTSQDILLAGEIGVETDTGKCKVGNGVDVFSKLKYIGIDEITFNIALNKKQDIIQAGTGITKSGVMLSIDNNVVMNKSYVTTVDSTTKIHTITHNRKTLVPIVKCYMDNVEFLPWEVKVVNENSLTLDLGSEIPSGKQIRVGVV